MNSMESPVKGLWTINKSLYVSDAGKEALPGAGPLLAGLSDCPDLACSEWASKSLKARRVVCF